MQFMIMNMQEWLIHEYNIMKYFIFFIYTLFFLNGSTYGQSNIQWQRCYGGSNAEDGYNIKNTLDGGYVVLGSSGSFDGDLTNNMGSSDIWIIKLKKNGAIEWQKSYGGSSDEGGSAIIATKDSGFIAAGFTSSNDGDIDTSRADSDQIWLIKLNKKGYIQWQKYYKGTGANAITSTPDGGYVIAAGTFPTSSYRGDFHILIIKTDSIGNVEWQKVFGGISYSTSESVSSIINANDSGYVFCGSTFSKDGDITYNHGESDAWVVKLRPNGTIEWQKTYGGSSTDLATGIIATQDSNYIIVGRTSSVDGDVSMNKGSNDAWVLKISSKDSLLWEKTFGGSSSDNAFGITSNTKREYFIAGSTASSNGDVKHNYGGLDAWVFKLKNDSFFDWGKTYGGTDDERAWSIANTSDSSIIFAGFTLSLNDDITYNHGRSDIWVVELAGHWQPKLLQNSGCLPDAAKLTTNNPISASDSVSLFWDFGDGKGYVSGGDTVYTPAFTKAGNYKIKLRVSNNRYGYTGTVLSEDSITISVTGKTLTTPSILLQGKDTLIASYSGDSCRWYLDSVVVSTGKCEYIPLKSGKYQVLVYDSVCPSPMSAAYHFTFSGVEEPQSNYSIQISPNPFTDHTNINYTLDKSESVLITVFDMTGRSIATLVNSQQSAGAHQIAFYPGLYSANPAGVYLLKMSIGSMESQYRLINLK